MNEKSLMAERKSMLVGKILALQKELETRESEGCKCESDNANPGLLPMVTVYKAHNGWVLLFHQTDCGESSTVIEENDRMLGVDAGYMSQTVAEIDAGHRALWEILNAMWLGGSKHDKFRLRVVIYDKDGKEANLDGEL